jgi:hypothetical protein
MLFTHPHSHCQAFGPECLLAPCVTAFPQSLVDGWVAFRLKMPERCCEPGAKVPTYYSSAYRRNFEESPPSKAILL